MEDERDQTGSVTELTAFMTGFASDAALPGELSRRPPSWEWEWGNDGGARAGAISIGANNGWCLTDEEQLELRELRAALSPCLGHLAAAEQRRVLTALDVAYQVRMRSRAV